MKRVTPTQMTPWEEGQVLSRASDALFDCADELRETKPEMADILFHLGCEVGDMFNKHGSHKFGLRGLKDCTCARCLRRKP